MLVGELWRGVFFLLVFFVLYYWWGEGVCLDGSPSKRWASIVDVPICWEWVG